MFKFGLVANGPPERFVRLALEMRETAHAFAGLGDIAN